MALKQIEAPAKGAKKKVRRGTGSGEYTVKGRRATARQRAVIDGVLSQCDEDNASRRVMIAAVMCITQESGAGELAGVTTGNDDVGIYQQGRNWISEKGAQDPAASTHAFLITGPTCWKKVHRSVKRAPGNLEVALKQVQISVGGYAPWEGEATKTVDSWLANGGEGEGDDKGGGTYIRRFTFTRGEKGGTRENSWDASARLTEEVGAYRWAAANVFYAVSGDELRAGAPALTIRGEEGWLVKQPAWSWAANRAISEVTLQVFADRWEVMPGAVVVLHRRFKAMAGRWMVWNVSGPSLDAPETTVVLRRPTRLKSEPPSEVATRGDGGGDAGGGGSSNDELRDICKQISDNRSNYLYGGGHGPKLSGMNSSDPMDCSSSSSLALYRAKMMGDREVAIVSGAFASSWGRPGKGKEFTVWANGGHMWTEGYDSDGSFAWRFDTSQHGGKSGPAFLTDARNDHARFTARHWPNH